jgi:dsRNA-specific ribonuclease
MSPPPFPALQNDTALTVFAHSSVRSPEKNDRADRLAFLGGKVLHMVTAETLEKKSTLNTVDLIVSARLNLMHISFSYRY